MSRHRLIASLLFLSLFLSQSVRLHAQLNLRDTPQPLAPQAAEITKFGTHNVNLYTGSISVSIPIGRYTDTDFDLPISLTYNYNGFRPNETVSEVGLGWTLSCGGVITRDVRGFPDEEVGQAGVVIDGKWISQDYQPHDNIPWTQYSETSDIFFNVLPSNASSDKAVPTAVVFEVPNNTDRVDSIFFDATPDVYHFSFMGHSGSFVRRYDGSFAVFDTDGQTTYSVEKTSDLASSYIGINGYVSEITITTGDGYKYVFGALNGFDKHSLYYCDRIKHVEPQPSDYNFDSIVSWSLNKVVAPSGRELLFDYRDSLSVRKDPRELRDFNILYWRSNSSNSNICNRNNNYRLMHSPLCTVKTGEREILNIKYKEKSNGQSGWLINGDSVQQEIGGVFASLLLTEIQFMNDNYYLSYSWNARGNPYPFLSKVSSELTGDYKMEYIGLDHGFFPSYGTQTFDDWGYLNKTDSSSCQRANIDWNKLSSTDTHYEETLDGSRSSNYSASSIGLLTKIKYPGGGCSEFTYESNSSSHAIRKAYGEDFYLRQYAIPMIGPGARINKIVNRDSDGSVKDSLYYIYQGFDGKPSGRLINYPRHKIAYNGTLGNDKYSEQKSVWYAMAQNLTRRGGVIVEYPCVTEFHSDNSKTEYEFSDWSMYPDTLDYKYTDLWRLFYNDMAIAPMVISENPNGLHRILAPSTSLAAMRGKIVRKREYAAGGLTPIRTTQYVYDSLNAERFREHVNIGDALGIINHYALNPRLIHTCETTGYPSGDVSVSSDKTYNSLGQLTSNTTLCSDGTQKRTLYTYPSDYPDNTVLTAMAKAGLNDYPVTETVQEKSQNGLSWVTISATRYTYAKQDNHGVLYNTYLPVLIEKQDAETGTWKTWESRSYDQYGNIINSIDATGHSSVYVWRKAGIGVGLIVQNATYSQLNNILTTSGDASDADIDSAANTVRNTVPEARVWKINYFRPGLPSSITDPDGVTREWTYDEAGRLTEENEDGIGRIFNIQYNSKTSGR